MCITTDTFTIAPVQASTQVLLRVDVLPWDSNAANDYGQIRARLEAQGIGLSALDMLIASHALSLGATLVTHDKAFGRCKGLRVEDWTL